RGWWTRRPATGGSRRPCRTWSRSHRSVSRNVIIRARPPAGLAKRLAEPQGVSGHRGRDRDLAQVGRLGEERGRLAPVVGQRCKGGAVELAAPARGAQGVVVPRAGVPLIPAPPGILVDARGRDRVDARI